MSSNAEDSGNLEEKCAKDWNCYVIEYEFETKKVFGLTKPHKVHDVLFNDEGPLSKAPQEGRMRYIHLPVNNTEWVESLIKRHCDTHHHTRSESRRERVLRNDLWKGQQHAGTMAHHARFMRPHCAVVPAGPPFDGSKQHHAVDVNGSQDPALGDQIPVGECSCCRCFKHKKPVKSVNFQDFVLFMPYLHWDTAESYKAMTNVIRSIDGKPAEDISGLPERDVRLLQAHLRKKDHKSDLYKSDLHIRRTLDQSYYWTLKSTEKRDGSQVVGKWLRGEYDKDIKEVEHLLMVDQLWMWILDGNTILTSFPRRWGSNPDDPSGTHKSLRETLKNNPEFTSIYDFALAILDQCSQVFFDRTRTGDNRPEVMDIFASAIGVITDKFTEAYETFWDSLPMVTEESGDDQERQSKAIERKRRKLLDINPEGYLSKEIKDILDELHSIRKICHEELMVAQDFENHLNDIPGLREARPETVRWAAATAKEIGRRISEVNELIHAAERTEKGLKNLLELKQMQANLQLALAAQEQTNQGAKQNMTVMLFTAITIIFLPLSFVCGIFGMNAAELGQGQMPISIQFAIMIPISLVIIAFTLTLAFSEGYRTICAITVRLCWAYFVKISGLLWLWHIWGREELENWKSEGEKRLDMIYKREKQNVGGIEKKV